MIIGTAAIASEKYKIKEQQIEEIKERNMKINQSAKSKAFDLMTLLFSFGFLALAMFGYMNKVSFFTVVGLFFICQVYYFYQLLKYMRRKS